MQQSELESDQSSARRTIVRALNGDPNDSWTRVMPMDWLLQRQSLLPCQPLDVAAP